MSRETQQWLENNIMVGYTNRRGEAWWYRGVDREDGTSNHFPEAIPVETVRAKLLNWTPEERPLFIPVYDDNGDDTGKRIAIPGKKAIVPSDDPSHVFGIFSESYVAHDFDDWLIGVTSQILDTGTDELAISSAGLLKGRAVAWVEFSVADTIKTNTGVDFRPNLLATTSLDGTVATTFKRTVTMTVCDNTWGMAMSEKGQQYKLKHSKYSNLKKVDAMDALRIIHDTADDVMAQIDALVNVDVTDDEFRKIVEQAIPIDDNTTKTGTTVANRKRGDIQKLWVESPMVAPWNGTAFGVVQAFNTWEHHGKPTRGDTVAAERNMMSTITGGFEKTDAEVVDIMRKLELLPA